ncbi:hypothetical protein R1flu_028008 [Riccia fluitans]|uniref:Uncharacterized protein n=1 Tax=Riccia fluitans TaxID=41844 RepID=A0ABD1XKJ9_9MARC
MLEQKNTQSPDFTGLSCALEILSNFSTSLQRLWKFRLSAFIATPLSSMKSLGNRVPPLGLKPIHRIEIYPDEGFSSCHSTLLLPGTPSTEGCLLPKRADSPESLLLGAALRSGRRKRSHISPIFFFGERFESELESQASVWLSSLVCEPRCGVSLGFFGVGEVVSFDAPSRDAALGSLIGDPWCDLEAGA